MSAIEEIFQSGGIWMYLMLALLPLSVIWISIQAFLRVRGRRFPALLWWGGPIAVFTIGCVGIGGVFGEALQVVEAAESMESQMRSLSRAVFAALVLGGFSSLVSLILGVGVAIGCGFSSSAGEQNATKWAYGAPGVVAAITMVGLCIMCVWLMTSDSLQTSNFWIPFVFLTASFGLLLSTLRTSDDPEVASRLAADRITVGFAAIFATLAALVYCQVAHMDQIFETIERNRPGYRRAVYENGIELSLEAWQFGGLAFLLMGVSVVIVVALMGRYILSRSVLIDVVLCVLFTLPAVGAFGYFMVQATPFTEAFEEVFLHPDPYQVLE